MEQSTWLKQRFGAGRKQSEDLVLYILATKLTDRIDKLTLLRNELEDQLSPLKTFPTALIEPIYTPLHRAFPRTQVFVWFSGLIGLVLGLLVVYMLTWRELRLQPPHA
jgi:LPS O-antigen subunit length determinant protein (WzzB/FepE family)